jgi:regulator of sigma E protease
MTDVISMLFWPLSGLVLISIVITVHELGHYWVGRMFGAAVESFSIGFGRSILERTDRRGTRWRLNWMPLGGFVKFVGEMQAPTDTRDDIVTEPESAPRKGKAKPAHPVGRPYTDLTPWKRLAVSLGGPAANFIFAIGVFAAMSMTLGVSQAKEVSVLAVTADSPASRAGFQPGDIVVEAAGRTVSRSYDVTQATQLSAGEAVTYRVQRGDQLVTLTATPKEETVRNEDLQVSEKVGRVGLELAQRDISIRQYNPIEAVGYGVTTTGDAVGATVNVLRRLVTGKDGLDKLSGPVGIFNLADKVTDLHLKRENVSFVQKIIDLLISGIQLAALLSIGVGFFNLLPIPVLDGGAAIMCVAEGVTGREIPENVQRIGLTIGLACLASFALLVTGQDLIKLFGWSAGS